MDWRMLHQRQRPFERSYKAAPLLHFPTVNLWVIDWLPRNRSLDATRQGHSYSRGYGRDLKWASILAKFWGHPHYHRLVAISRLRLRIRTFLDCNLSMILDGMHVPVSWSQFPKMDQHCWSFSQEPSLINPSFTSAVPTSSFNLTTVFADIQKTAVTPGDAGRDTPS